MNLARATQILALVALSAFLAPRMARADILFLVTVDTSAVSTGAEGFLDFQFNAGGTDSQPATAVVRAFGATGLSFSDLTTTGAALSTGPLPSGSLDFANTTADNESLQAVAFGSASTISFTIDLGGPAVNAPDGVSTAGTTFSFGLLDAAYNPLQPTSGPSDPLFVLDIGAMTGALTPSNDS